MQWENCVNVIWSINFANNWPLLHLAWFSIHLLLGLYDWSPKLVVAIATCQYLTIHLSCTKLEDVSIDPYFKRGCLLGNQIHFLQLWMELHWFWWHCQHMIVWKLTPVLNFLLQSEEAQVEYRYLYWISF